MTASRTRSMERSDGYGWRWTAVTHWLGRGGRRAAPRSVGAYRHERDRLPPYPAAMPRNVYTTPLRSGASGEVDVTL